MIVQVFMIMPWNPGLVKPSQCNLNSTSCLKFAESWKIQAPLTSWNSTAKMLVEQNEFQFPKLSFLDDTVSIWSGKYVIGLTGNIASGKSVVRKMLEHLGAYGIDADALSHRAIAKGAPGYKPAVALFGNWVLDQDGQIDRLKLGKLVFNDPEALRKLEAIIHPLVRQAVEVLALRASQRVIVIEAIKLLEGDLRAACDSVWVTTSPESLQAARLMAKRGMGRDEALARIRMQPPQTLKASQADVLIENEGTFEDTWQQVLSGWKRVVPQPEPVQPVLEETSAGEFAIIRGRPRDSSTIADLINRLSSGALSLDTEEIMSAFGEMAFLLIRQDGRLVGVAGWQVENLVARTKSVYIDSSVSLEPALRSLIAEVEQASIQLQCEASLVFVPSSLAIPASSLKQLGYEQRTPRELGVQAWHDAALESASTDSVMFFKQLRQDRVLRPI